MNVSVDTSCAGPGELDINVKAGTVPVSCKVVPHRTQRQCFKVYFIPREPVTHFIAVTFSADAVPGMC